jgi:hypothetical protein
MARTTKKRPAGRKASSSASQVLKSDAASVKAESDVHVFGKGIRCDTEPRGHATPSGRPIQEIVVDASEGFIPLWARNTTLRWRFREHTMKYFKSPAAAKNEIRKLLAEAILAWGDAAPVKFAERTDAWDFEVVMRASDDCDGNGCVLASAFFPDAGRHQLVLYPMMFSQTRPEQVETLVHEIGHVFGLRHFFADVSETAWPSQVFGKHRPFTIMNYGSQSVLTADDRSDLKKLYQLVWAGSLTQINGTPVKLFKPFHLAGAAPESMVALELAAAAPQALPRAAYLGTL